MSRNATIFLLAVLSVFTLSSIASANCTQGFWKNHPENWNVDSLLLGDTVYTNAQLLEIFDEPVAGNGLISLAHQLIAAKLNNASGAVNTVAAEIAAADALIGALVIPPHGTGWLDPNVTSDLVDALTAFNELPGDPNGFGGCQPITVEEWTWGRVKAGYR